MNIHAADGEDIQDNLAGRDDHRSQLVVELEPINSWMTETVVATEYKA